MPIVGPWQRKKVLITARTYPTPAKKGVEVSCTAGVTEEGEWIRLFPIPYRFLDFDKRFRKYQWIEVDVAKSSDHRPESFEVNIDSLEIISEPLSTTSEWQARKDIVYPLKAHCLCCLQSARNLNGYPTLGFFKPKQIRRFVMRAENPDWNEVDLAKLSQASMFDKEPMKILEKIPFKFIYQIYCDDSSCRGHHLSCTDWELGQAYRSWKDKYPENWKQKLGQKFEYDMVERFDTHLFVGTVSSHPASWIIVGLFYPLKRNTSQLSLPIL